jgi:tetratricopeptide (TPR) repeat protein
MKRLILILVVNLLLLLPLVSAIGCNDAAAEHTRRAEALLSEGQWDLAIADLNKAIELDPKLAVAYNNRGWAYNGKGQRDLAIADFKMCINLSQDPSLTQATKQILEELQK